METHSAPFKYVVNIEQWSCESLYRVIEHGGEVFNRQHLQELPDLYTRQLHHLPMRIGFFSGALFRLDNQPQRLSSQDTSAFATSTL